MTRSLFCTFCLWTTLLCPAVLLAQGVGKPKMTNIPGGLFVEWMMPVEVAAIQLDKNLTGSYEVMFDVPSVQYLADEIDKTTPPTNNPDMVSVLADYWMLRGKPDRAILLYEEILKQGSLDSALTLVFQNNLAMLYSRTLGQHSQALEIVNKALETNKDNVMLLDTKGLVLLNNANPTEAVPVLERAVELSCQLPIYCMHLAYALQQDGRASQARRYLDQARDRLISAAPTMTKENKAMFDSLQLNLPPVQ